MSPFATDSADASPPASSVDEHALIEHAKRDRAAFGQIYQAHYDAILNYLYRRSLSITLAEELTSNTFFHALRKISDFQPRASIRIRSWLYRIATNELHMHYRRRRHAAVSLNPEDAGRILWPPSPSAPTQQENREEFLKLHQALARLPQLYQTTLILRYFEKLPHEQIAQILHKRPGTIKSLVHRGLAKLNQLLAPPNATP